MDSLSANEEHLSLHELIAWHEEARPRARAIAEIPNDIYPSYAKLDELSDEIAKTKAKMESAARDQEFLRSQNESVECESMDLICELLIDNGVMPQGTTTSDLRIAGELLVESSYSNDMVPHEWRESCQTHLIGAAKHRDWSRAGFEDLLSKTTSHIKELELRVKKLEESVSTTRIARRQAPGSDMSSQRAPESIRADVEGRERDDGEDNNSVFWKTKLVDISHLLVVERARMATMITKGNDLRRLVIHSSVYEPDTLHPGLLRISAELLQPYRERFPTDPISFQEGTTAIHFASRRYPLKTPPRMEFCQFTFQAMIEEIKGFGHDVIIGQLTDSHIPFQQLHRMTFDGDLLLALYVYFDFVTTLPTTRGITLAAIWFTLASLCRLSRNMRGPWSLELARINAKLADGPQTWCDMEKVAYLVLHSASSPSVPATVPQYFLDHEPDFPAAAILDKLIPEDMGGWNNNMPGMLQNLMEAINTTESSRVLVVHNLPNTLLLVWLMRQPGRSERVTELCWAEEHLKGTSFCEGGLLLSEEYGVRPRKCHENTAWCKIFVDDEDRTRLWQLLPETPEIKDEMDEAE